LGKEQPATGHSRAVFDSLQEMPGLTERLGAALVDDPPLVLKERNFPGRLDSDSTSCGKFARREKLDRAIAGTRDCRDRESSAQVRFNSVFRLFHRGNEIDLAMCRSVM